MKKFLVVFLLLPMFAQADDLQLPTSIDGFREAIVKSFVEGYFFAEDSKIPGEARPTYSITLTRDPSETGDLYVYRFVRTAPDQVCGGIIYQNVAGSNELADTDCK